MQWNFANIHSQRHLQWIERGRPFERRCYWSYFSHHMGTHPRPASQVLSHCAQLWKLVRLDTPSTLPRFPFVQHSTFPITDRHPVSTDHEKEDRWLCSLRSILLDPTPTKIEPSRTFRPFPQNCTNPPLTSSRRRWSRLLSLPGFYSPLDVLSQTEC